MQRERHNAFKLIIIQATIVSVMSVLFGFFSLKSAYSIFLGGFCCILPSIYFAYKLFKSVSARMLGKAMGALYFGEVIKLFLIGVLSILVFKFIPIIPMDFFIGFICAQLAFWVAPNFMLLKQARAARGAL
jgi:ATP synthase protein I